MGGKWGVAIGVAAATITVVVALMVVSSVQADARADGLTPAHLGESLAALMVLDAEVEHRATVGSAWVAAIDGQGLDEGDGVRTDATGFGEILYADGSLTRVDVQSELQVISLSQTNVAPEISVGLEVGRVWNRVQDVTGERGSFEVETPVGTAAVRGTVFIVECDRQPVCTFTVIEGLVEVTTLDGQVFLVGPGEELTLGIDGRDGGVGFAGGGGGEPGGPFDGGGTDGGANGSGGAAGGAGGSGGSGGPTGFGDGTSGPAFLNTLGPGESVVALGQDAPGLGPLLSREFVAHNLGIDAADGRDVTGSEACSVSVAGRNAKLASTPDTAIEVPLDEDLAITAVATGDLDRYRVDLYLADVSLLAAEGEVLADDLGDKTTFRGNADVSEYAWMGSGLYEVRARTTGTVCDVRAFVNVTGGSPLLTGPALLGLLMIAGGATGIAGAAKRFVTAGQPLASLVSPVTAAPSTTSDPKTIATIGGFSALGGLSTFGGGAGPDAGTPTGEEVD